ncbi:FAH family protein [Streptomyces ipomoeae 91-03]|uniref:FAH family protein n=1 Tax=Streptomyces ipomoeae 91-03 TaxID=698759 RepID=L1KNB0_9ACTN|nr:FAH family protein [Streptomyces ipomoeae 91-03]
MEWMCRIQRIDFLDWSIGVTVDPQPSGRKSHGNARATCRPLRARHVLRSLRSGRGALPRPPGRRPGARPERRPGLGAVRCARRDGAVGGDPARPALPRRRRHPRLAGPGGPAGACPDRAPPDLPVRRQLPAACDRPGGRPPPPDDPRTVEEARAEIAAVMDRRAAEDLPYVFIGLPSTITGPYDDVVLPSWAKQPDWELELAAVIARPAHRVSVEEALEYVAGYTIANDLTDRATVFRRDMKAIGTDWLRCKNAPGFTPLGPWLVPAGSIADPGDLRVTLKLNGETMQDESTKDMLFGVARLVSYISQTARLLPGDLVLTGSPAGNGIHWGRLLRDGDVMEGSITGLGVQRTRCVEEGTA